MGVNLDRFSQPLTSETSRYKFEDLDITVEKVVVCKGCNIVIYEEENIVESKIWVDDFMHDCPECINAYYEKEQIKDPFAANKRVG